MSQTETDYDQWAWLYDKTLGPDYSANKMAFLDQVLLSRMPAGARILDLCCGTGQMITPLIEKGFDVSGLDISTQMLAYAARNTTGATLRQGDARDFSFEQKFEGVICASASLNHMRDASDLAEVFACVNRALKLGGTFVFDINHPDQMAQYWRGQPAAGDIRRNYAWLITPRYDADTASGAFRVDMYLRPEEHETPFWHNLLDGVLSSRFLWRLRLRRLASFGATHPGWTAKSTDYQVHGHDLEQVCGLLCKAGFDPDLQTITGDRLVTTRDAAFFVCQKKTEVLHAQEAAE